MLQVCTYGHRARGLIATTTPRVVYVEKGGYVGKGQDVAPKYSVVTIATGTWRSSSSGPCMSVVDSFWTGVAPWRTVIKKNSLVSLRRGPAQVEQSGIVMVVLLKTRRGASRMGGCHIFNQASVSIWWTRRGGNMP